MFTKEEYQTYYKIQHKFLLEDARYYVADYLELDVDDESLDKYDYEYLVQDYQDREDCNVSFNDTWQSVVSDYLADFDEAERR